MFVGNVFKKITQENHFAKISSKKVLTSTVGFLGINQKGKKKRRGREDSKLWGSHHPVEYLIGAQFN